MGQIWRQPEVTQFLANFSSHQENSTEILRARRLYLEIEICPRCLLQRVINSKDGRGLKLAKVVPTFHKPAKVTKKNIIVSANLRNLFDIIFITLQYAGAFQCE